MATEAELKLRLSPAHHAAIARSGALAGARPRRRRLDTIYFDTPERTLAAHGMVLRLRRDGARWIQGLKAANAAGGGLHVRQEWEHAAPEPVIDLARFADTPLARLEGVADLHTRLAPAFRVEMSRTAWRLATGPGARLEVALDEGRVTSGGRSERISELEIECLEGAPRAAFDLAFRLLDDAPLHPSTVTKAERGYRLFGRGSLEAVKAQSLDLAQSRSPLAAARRIVGAGLAQLQANEEGVLRGSDPELVHQARIALRRMRSALRMFRDPVGAERASAWRDALGDVARALGAARDWDVFGIDTFPKLAAACGDEAAARTLAGRIARERRSSRAAARAALNSTEYARVILELAQWIAEGQDDDADGAEPLRHFAARTLRKRHKRLLRDAAGLAQLPAVERHRVRIDVKRLRYGLDALASLYKPRRVEAYRAALVALQDALGETNDAATGFALLPRLHPPEDLAAFARGWLGARAQGDPAMLTRLNEDLAAARPFWR